MFERERERERERKVLLRGLVSSVVGRYQSFFLRGRAIEMGAGPLYEAVSMDSQRRKHAGKAFWRFQK